MSKKIETVHLTPFQKHQILSQYNFDESEENVEKIDALVKNEGNQAAELVNILKEEALTDPTAIEEISEATDMSPEIIQGLADTKGESLEKAKEEDMSKEEAEEYYFSKALEILPSLINSSISKYQYQALFSEETAVEGTSNPDKDTLEAIKLVKYVDPESLKEEGASDVAQIIAESTDGDKEAIESVLETVETAVDEQKSMDEYFFGELLTETINQMEVRNQEETSDTISDLLAALKRADEEIKARIANGEDIQKRVIPTLDRSEEIPTETDPLSQDDVSKNLPEAIASSVKKSVTNSQVENPAVAPAENPMLAFSNNVGRLENGKRVFMPGDPNSILNITANFGNQDNDASAVLANILSAAEYNCRK